MRQPLDGRQVVLTGASGGLGVAVLEAFLAAGATCHVPTITAGELAERPNTRIVPGVDLTDEASVVAFYASCPPLWASVHLAGGYAAAPIERTSLADLRRQMDLNLTTAFLCCREAVGRIRAGSPVEGRIVNVTARAALVPVGNAVAYSAAKGAVALLTQALAAELKGSGILVNAVAPSIIDTPANRRAMPDADPAKWPKPEELARTLLWLASPENALTSGAIVPVYGAA